MIEITKSPSFGSDCYCSLIVVVSLEIDGIGGEGEICFDYLGGYR
jgi:hypothetical protein